MKISRKDLLSMVMDSLNKCTSPDQYTFDLGDSATKVYAASLYRRVSESVPEVKDVKLKPEGWAKALVDTMKPVAEGSDELEIESPEDTTEQVVADSLSMSSISDDQLADMKVVEPAVEARQPTFKLATEAVDLPWNDQAQAELKTKLREAKVAGEPDIDQVIKSVYASCDPSDPNTWKYPYRSPGQDMSLPVNPYGVEKAVVELIARDAGSRESKIAVANELLVHAPQHPLLSAVAEAKPGVQMVTLEVLKGDETVLTLSTADVETGRQMCVAEAAANLLRDVGLLKVDGPTVVQIDDEQLGLVCTNLAGVSKVLMGELGEVAESATTVAVVDPKIVDELDSTKKLLRLVESKMDALQSLLSSSPLKGVAESIVGAESLEAVTAFKSVSESIDIKRLITARRAQRVLSTETDAEVEESGGNFEQLSKLLDGSEKGSTGQKTVAQTTSKSRLSMYI